MANTKAIGDTTTAAVMAALVKAGKNVLLPFGDNQRYDLVVEEGNSFYRVQCKTAHVEEGSVAFNTSSSTYHRSGGGRKSYRGQADFFGVYCPSIEKVYLVRVDDVGVTEARLRLDGAKNNQSKRTRPARDYELDDRFAASAAMAARSLGRQVEKNFTYSARVPG